MADLQFFVDQTVETHGSGLGFFGGGFGQTVKVGEFQQTTFITDGNGNVQGAQADNVKWAHPNSGLLGSATTPTALLNIPNKDATLKIQFNHDSHVKTTNAELRIYDRSNINNGPSGVTTMVAETIHPDTSESNPGSGDTTWTNAAGSGSVLSLAKSPGSGGHFAADGNDGGWTGLIHNWYVSMTASPDSVGSKTQFGAYFSVEYFI